MAPSRSPSPDLTNTGRNVGADASGVMDELPTQEPMPDGDPAIKLTFAGVLAQTRTYRRVEHLEVDAVSLISTTRSHGWSVLSGFSSSQVTRIGVINLPLRAEELMRIRNPLLSPGSFPTRSSFGAIPAGMNRVLHEQLDVLGRAPLKGIAAGPTGDSIVKP